MAQIPVGPQVSQIWTGKGQVVVANQDYVNSVTVCNNQNITVGAMNGDVIPPLGSIAYNTTQPLFAIAPSGTAALLVVSGGTNWSPSPAQVAEQIAISGLMTEATGQLVNTNAHIIATNTGGALTDGVPPGVPNVGTVKQLFGTPGSSPYTMFTFPADGRIWGSSLSASATASSGYSSGTTNIYAQLKTGSGITLEIVEMALVAPSTVDSEHGDFSFYGIDVNAGDTLLLDVNNGMTVSGAIVRASGFVMYSIP